MDDFILGLALQKKDIVDFLFFMKFNVCFSDLKRIKGLILFINMDKKKSIIVNSFDASSV